MTSRIRPACSASFLAIIITIASAGAGYTQGASGSVSGTVKDETGGLLPGASVQVTNADTSLTRTLVTDANGRYTAPDLPPGPYEVKATLPGFSTVVRSGIRLTVGRDAVVDLTLKLGQISDQITVIGESPTVDLKTASTGG